MGGRDELPSPGGIWDELQGSGGAAAQKRCLHVVIKISPEAFPCTGLEFYCDEGCNES